VTVPRFLLLLAVVLGACGDRDPHAAATCDGPLQANGFTECELACADSSVSLVASGPSCQGITVSGSTVDCSKTFEFEGVTGCCASNAPQLRFAECQ